MKKKSSDICSNLLERRNLKSTLQDSQVNAF